MSVYKFRKDDLESALNRNAIWAIVYGDLMSYLMILFLMMYSYSLANTVTSKTMKIDRAVMEITTVFGGEVSKEVAERAKQRDMENLVIAKLRKKTDEGAPDEEASLIVTEKKIELNLGSGVLFDSGKSELKEDALPILKKYTFDIVSTKNQIRVEGHTDSVPVGKRSAYKSNWELSMARTYSVIRALEAMGVDPQRLSGIGYGEYRPAADNKTAEGRSKNRRIAISLTRVE